MCVNRGRWYRDSFAVSPHSLLSNPLFTPLAPSLRRLSFTNDCTIAPRLLSPHFFIQRLRDCSAFRQIDQTYLHTPETLPREIIDPLVHDATGESSLFNSPPPVLLFDTTDPVRFLNTRTRLVPDVTRRRNLLRVTTEKNEYCNTAIRSLGFLAFALRIGHEYSGCDEYFATRHYAQEK